MSTHLTDYEKHIIFDKGTEAPFTGEYLNNKTAGTYYCKACGQPLYRSADKFDSGCGWPSFDDEIKGAVKRIPDADGIRTEIQCANCGGHLGHVFEGEGFTPKNTRHCVNSASMRFVADNKQSAETLQTAYFAGGCFWGVEHLLQQQEGVISVESGYMGGRTANPSYEEVSGGRTGHAETVKVVFDPSVIPYEALAKLFFEIHDPTQLNRQGPDIGEQYRSEIFYTGKEQFETASRLIGILKGKGLNVRTELTPAEEFYPAEEYHQDYYERNGKQPYCHIRTKRF